MLNSLLFSSKWQIPLQIWIPWFIGNYLPESKWWLFTLSPFQYRIFHKWFNFNIISKGYILTILINRKSFIVIEMSLIKFIKQQNEFVCNNIQIKMHLTIQSCSISWLEDHTKTETFNGNQILDQSVNIYTSFQYTPKG